MNHDPISDVLNFLQQPAFVSGPAWPSAVFWVLVLASLAIAVYAFAAARSVQRSPQRGRITCRAGCAHSHLGRLPGDHLSLTPAPGLQELAFRPTLTAEFPPTADANFVTALDQVFRELLGCQSTAAPRPAMQQGGRT
jgi:hypothetical protein